MLKILSLRQRNISKTEYLSSAFNVSFDIDFDL